MDQFRIRLLCPAPRGCIEFVREDAHGNRDGDAFGIEIPFAKILPIETGARERGVRQPAAEWVAFTASCNLRDMGTHLCALPTGEHCPKGLICLGCAHAQPKKSAVPIFRRMLASHERSLVAARGHSEPAGQIAAREMEIVRIKGALQRAEELSDDVAAAIERAL